MSTEQADADAEKAAEEANDAIRAHVRALHGRCWSEGDREELDRLRNVWLAAEARVRPRTQPTLQRVPAGAQTSG